MINGLKPYPAYKDSGVPWLGEVPEHWEVRRLKYLLRERDARSETGTEHLLSVSQYAGVTERKPSDNLEEPDTRAESLVGYKRVDPDELVVNIMLAWNGSMGVSRYAGIVSPAYCVYRFEALAEPWYFHHLLRSPVYKARIKAVSTGVVESRLRLYTDNLYRLIALLPPLPEQTAIVRFLDYMDRRIRRYIRAKQKLIKLLEEYKQAIIHQAVTGQIDVRTGKPYPAYKDSGVPWLGKVPAHWEVRRLKTLCRMRAGENITSQAIEPSGEFPVYGGNGVRGYTSEFTHEGEFILIGRQGALCGNVHMVQGRFWASEHAIIVSLYGSHDLRWFAVLLDAMNLNQYSMAAAQPGLAVERVLNLLAPVPSAEEQRLIAEYSSLTTSRIATAIAAARREIELLREYRERLIADVVTGKVDVREVAARLPEESEEPDLPEEEINSVTDESEEANETMSADEETED